MNKKPLHDILCEVVGGPFPDGKSHCYYQPPADKKISYPCIIYKYLSDLDDFADNMIYKSSKRYSLTVIDTDPDSEILSRVKKLNYCIPDRNYSSDGLNHFVYTLYYDGPRIKIKED